MFYRDEVYRGMAQANPEMKFRDIFVKIGEQFKSMTEEQKQKYKDMAAKHMEEKLQ